MDPKDYQEFNGIDGEPVKFEWNLVSRHTILDLLHEIQREVAENKIRPENFRDRISFMSMYTDVEWSKGEITLQEVYFELYGSQGLRKQVPEGTPCLSTEHRDVVAPKKG